MDAFSTDPTRALSRGIESTPSESQLSSKDLEEIFELTRVSEWISPYSSVSLQFPDSLLQYAPGVASRLGSTVVHVLGDSSYSPCCADVVAAQHLGAEALVHFGEACLSTENKADFPILYVYTELKLCESALVALREGGEDKTLLMYDVGYSKALEKAELPLNIRLALPSRDETSNRLGGRSVPPSSEFDRIIYIGHNPSFLLLIALTHPDKELLTLANEPNTSLQPAYPKISQLVMKRYVNIEKARDACRIGLLVGTLSTQGYLNSLKSLRSAIVQSGKRAYTFLLGKPNPAKLANFPEINVFVYISCPLSVYAMADTSKEYLQPIISPFELELSLNSNRSWEGHFSGDLSQMLPGGRLHVPFEPLEGPDVSLLSGGIRMMGLSKSTGRPSEDNALLESETRVSELHSGGGGGSFLASRSWKGLEQQLGESEVPSEIVEGRKGIATRYVDEPQ